MDNLWLGVLVAGIIIICIFLVLYFSGLFDRMNFSLANKKLAEDAYAPLLMLEGIGQKCLSQIGNSEIELIFDVDKNLPAKLYGDENRLCQVILSLLDNSIRFTEKGYVRLLFKVYPMTEPDMIELHISVKDTGKGISRKEIEHLFAFRKKARTKEGQETLGGGLFISQRLVGKMGGEIHVKSEEGRGSEFWFSIQQRVADPMPAAYIKRPENARVPKVSAKFSNPYREEALMNLLNMYKVSFVPYDILRDVGMMVDYLFTDHGVFYESEKEMLELVRRKENICVLENPQRDHKKLEGVTIVYRPFFSLNFCQFLSQG